MFAELQECDKILERTGGRGGVGGGVGGPRRLGAMALIIKASRASPTSCLLLNPAPSKKRC